MTKAEISAALPKINKNYKTNEWLSFNDVTAIVLGTSGNIYPSRFGTSFKNEFFFDDTNELLYERIIDVNGDTNPTIVTVVTYDNISALNRSTPINPYGSYVFHK